MYYMIAEFFLFFIGMGLCACFIGRICEEGDYNDYD